MNPVNDFLFDPDPSIGGAIVPIVGMPGSGKTIALTQIGLENLDTGNTVMWRGTKQCQWMHFLANDIDVTVWNHDTITDFHTYITGGNDAEPEEIDLERHGVSYRTWENPADLIMNLQDDVVNVVNVPGLSTQSKSDMYFFRKTWIDIFDSLIARDDGRMICFLFDEIGDVIPSQQQLRKPFYKLVAEFLPPKLAQLRKKRVLLYAAAHSTHDTHYFLWKIKSNSIAYMSNSVVKKNVTPAIDQERINSLDRGELVFPPKTEPIHINLPYMAKGLPWIPDRDSAFVEMDWTADIPDLLENDDDGDSRKSLSKIGAELWQSGLGTQQEIADALGLKQQAVSAAASDLDNSDDESND